MTRPIPFPPTGPLPGPGAPDPPSRRAVIAGLSVAAVATVLTGPAPLRFGTEPDTLTVWKLAADWREPRGPHGKTALESRASRNAAANRYARTERDALDMNLHRCSWAPAVPVAVCRAAFERAWDDLARPWSNPWNGRTVVLLDRRWILADGGAASWREVVGVCGLPLRSESDRSLGDAVADERPNRDGKETVGRD